MAVVDRDQNDEIKAQEVLLWYRKDMQEVHMALTDKYKTTDNEQSDTPLEFSKAEKKSLAEFIANKLKEKQNLNPNFSDK